jgi:ABC-type branched-subunit amino acid transport system substrate-binding protein
LLSCAAVAVVGEVCSAATVAAAGVSTTAKMPLISPAATSPALSGEDFFFRTVPSDR